MHTIWSRTTHSTCSSRCFSSTAVAGRFSQSGGRRPVWRIPKPSSTFAYSAIFAAATLLDGAAKRSRNKQWDDAIEELGTNRRQHSATEEYRRRDSEPLPSDLDESLMFVPLEQEDEEFSISWPSSFYPPQEKYKTKVLGKPLELYEAVQLGSEHRHSLGNEIFEHSQAVRLSLDHAESLGNELFDDVEELRSVTEYHKSHDDSIRSLLVYDSSRPGHLRLSLPQTLSHISPSNYPPQSLYSLDDKRHKARGLLRTKKKLALQQLAMSLVIHKFLFENLHPVNKEHLPKTVRDIFVTDVNEFRQIRRDINDHIRSVRALENQSDFTLPNKSGEFITPSYHEDVHGTFHSIGEELQNAVCEIFDSGGTDGKYKGVIPSRSEQAELLSKIAYNLYISSAPPNVHLFNLLLVRLQEWRRADLVRTVIQAMYVAKIRPNEITCASILDFYRVTNRPEEFSDFATRMRGIDNPLMYAQPSIKITKGAEGRLFQDGKGNIVQKMAASPIIFHALMRGVCRFTTPKRAVEIYCDMKEDGWALNMHTLCYLLKTCVFHADWQSSSLVWEDCRDLMLQRGDKASTIPYDSMMALAMVKGYTKAYNMLFIDATDRGYERDRLVKSTIKRADELRNKYRIKHYPGTLGDSLLITMRGYMKDGIPTITDEGPQEPQVDPDDFVLSEAQILTDNTSDELSGQW